MSYCRFVPGFTRHPKRLKCGPISSWLWVCSVDYCMEHLTDGFLDDAVVPSLCSSVVGSALQRAVNNLVAVGSWERVPGGYHVHDYLQHNLSKAQVEADREAGRQRYRKWKSNTSTNAVSNGGTNAVIPDSLGRSVGRTDTSTTSKDDSRHPGPKRIGDLLR